MTAKLQRLLVPGLTTLVMLAILIALGTWQVERLQWKTALLAQMDAAEAAPGVPLLPAPEPFEKVRVEGQLLGNLRAAYGAEVRDSRDGPILGTQLIVPMQSESAQILLVDLGWIPTDRDRGRRPPLRRGRRRLRARSACRVRCQPAPRVGRRGRRRRRAASSRRHPSQARPMPR